MKEKEHFLKMNLQFFAEGEDGGNGGDPKPQVESRNLSSVELQEALRGVVNIPENDRGALALEMVNITNATDRIIRERNEARETNEKLQKDLEQANQRIGQLYGQVTQKETIGEDPVSKINTTKTLMDLGRK